MRLSSKECTLLLNGNNDFSFLVNRGVIEETINILKIQRFLVNLGVVEETINILKIQCVLNEFEHLWGSH